jgi:hypothetical protein
MGGIRNEVRETNDLRSQYLAPSSAVRFTDYIFIFSLIPPMNRWATIIRPRGRTGLNLFAKPVGFVSSGVPPKHEIAGATLASRSGNLMVPVKSLECSIESHC